MCKLLINQRYLKNQIGFTLIELTISIGIFMMIGGLVLVNFRAGQYTDELLAGAKALETAVREVQASALGGQAVCVDSGGNQSVPLGGFGLHISADNTTALLFADCDYGDSTRSYIYNSNTVGVDLPDQKIKDIDLGNNVKIKNKIPIAISGSVLDVVFTSGSEVSKINGEAGTTEVVITLEHNKTLKTKTVKINVLSGQVFVE